jgi:hypothetical protein
MLGGREWKFSGRVRKVNSFVEASSMGREGERGPAPRFGDRGLRVAGRTLTAGDELRADGGSDAPERGLVFVR